MTASVLGEYTVTEQRLSQVITDASVILLPKATWEQLGMTEEAYTKTLQENILRTGTWHISGTTLTITDDNGDKTVLQRI